MLKQNSLQLLSARDEIEGWLDEMKVHRYQLIEDPEHGFVVDVGESVSIMNKKFTYLPVKFNTVKGNFCVSYNQLNTLFGCPEIIHGDFYCANNDIGSLEFFPKIVKGSCYISSNPSLGHVQYINDFNQLLELHQEIDQIKNEHTVLDHRIAKPHGIFQGKHKI